MPSPRLPRLSVALSLVAAIAVGMISYHFAFGGANAGSHDHTAGEIRVAARSLDDGRVEVAVQQRAADADWGNRQLPDARFLPPDAEPDEWRVSSGVPISADDDSGGPLLCIAAHGTGDDNFWRLLRGFSRQSAIHLGLNVRFTNSADGAAQAAEIDRCTADGAAVIASTLADPDAVRDSLLAAKAAGVRVATFNSGNEADVFSVGAEIHIGLDDAAAGRLAGAEFNKLDTTGNIGCLIHEARNEGLITRCAELGATYEGGETIHVQLPPGGDTDTVQAAVEARLLDPDQPPLAVLIALNGDTAFAALRAILATADQLEQTVTFASVGWNSRMASIPSEDREPRQLFVIGSAAEPQGYLVTSILQMLQHSPRNPKFVTTPMILRASPFINSNRGQGTPEERQEVRRRLLELLALGDEYLD